MRSGYLRLWIAATIGGAIAGLAFARLGLRPWQAWPVGAVGAVIAWLALGFRRR